MNSSGSVTLPVIAVMAAWTVGLLFLVPFVLRRLGLTRMNFRGDLIPAGYGIYVLFWMIPALIVWRSITADRTIPQSYAVVLIYGILGFVDDKWGDRRYSGLKGHVKALLVDHTVTTGLIKAVGGVAVGIAAGAMIERDLTDTLLAGLIIALTANAFNLVDLRPGRAGALFLLFAGVLVIASSPVLTGLALVLVPALIVYIPDCQGRVMLGDAGSNLLGALLGLSLILAIPSPIARLLILAVLVGLHVAAERVSLTEIIDRNPVLRQLDGLTGVR